MRARSTMKPVIAFLASALVAAAAITNDTHAQNYPTKPVRLIVAFPAGGGSDVIGRIIAPRLTDRFGQQVVVDNRPGAGGLIGTEAAVKSAPDGYTLLLGFAEIVISPSLYAKLPYDILRDLTPVTALASTPMVLIVHPSMPVNTAKDLVALAKARPGQINYGSAGNGTAMHLAAELFRYVTNVSIVHVPYKGGPPALSDLVGGHVQIVFSTLPAAMPLVKAGRLKPLAVSSLKRASGLPDVPTVVESGINNYEVEFWYGLFVPTGTSKDIVARVHGETAQILKLPDTIKKLGDQGAESVSTTQEQFADFVKAEIAKWAMVVKTSGAKLD